MSSQKTFIHFSVLSIVTFLSLFTVTTAILSFVKPVSAADKRDWTAGNIISDTEFTNASSMSVDEIQAFLDKSIGNCDIWGTARATEYGYNGTHAQYAASRGWPAPPYTCINKYYEVPKTVAGGGVPASNYSNPSSIPPGAQSAAWIIKDAAQRYNISPKVLLVKLATESLGPLTSDQWPLFSQYKYVMGAQCPDSGPGGSANCNDSYAGFSIQMYESAALLRAYLTNMDKAWWTHKKPNQNNKILWNVEPRGCGASDVYIENKATAALYTYTPYQPNQASLNNMYGTGDNCSAYGNRNFWRVYVDWFGMTPRNAYQWEETSRIVYTDDRKQTVLNQTSVKQGQYLFVEYKVKNTGSVTWRKDSLRLGTSTNRPSVNATPDWLSNNRAATLTEQEVKAGETGTISFWIRTPTTPGIYKEYYNLVIENVSWLVDIGSYLELNVNGSPVRQALSSASRTLKRGDSIQSPDTKTVLMLTPYGSLSLYRNTELVWRADTPPIDHLVFQDDGNLVAYTKAGAAAWVQNGTPQSSLMATNGGLEFSDTSRMIWSVPTDGSSPAPDNLGTERILFKDQSLWSKKGAYRLTLQSDGNLVQYGPSGAMWATNVPKGLYLAQQDDGNLVVYGFDGNAVWASHRAGIDARTFVQEDGNIVSYGSKGPIWSSR